LFAPLQFEIRLEIRREMQFFTLFFDCAPAGPADENPHRTEKLTVAKPIIYPIEKTHIQYYHQRLPSLKEFLTRA
jgi:hypothetical protein